MFEDHRQCDYGRKEDSRVTASEIRFATLYIFKQYMCTCLYTHTHKYEMLRVLILKLDSVLKLCQET